MNNKETKHADVCLILEGTYPYVSGGVAHWTHDLINQQSDLTFNLVCILPPDFRPKLAYEIPKNVVSLKNIYLQELPDGSDPEDEKVLKKFFGEIELPLIKLQHFGLLKDLKNLIEIIEKFPGKLGKKILMESEASWEMTLRMYREMMGESSFLNFYFSWKGLISSFYSIVLADIPPSSVFHAVCTGYAGLFLACAHLKTGKPSLITEHGIYTNERRIEITLADWLYDQKTMNLSIDRSAFDRDLKDYWIDTFFGYSKLCYDSCEKIITLYEGNQEYQLADAADPQKLLVIPNGVDIERYASLKHESNHPPTAALIGRVVPIKDIKTFLHAVAIVKENVPNLKAFVLGPTEEDPDYYQECLELVSYLNLQETVTFTGKVNVEDYYPKIDVLVLTSISESQPLVVLEAGAAGIPSVTTDAGCCSELIFGAPNENPPLGPGGAVTPLSNPTATAEGITLLLNDQPYYEACSKNIKERMRLYYDVEKVKREYQLIYQSLIQKAEATIGVS